MSASDLSLTHPAPAIVAPPAQPESPDPASEPLGARAVRSRAQDAVLALGRRAVAVPDADLLLIDAARLIGEIAGTEFALIDRTGSGGSQHLVDLAGNVVGNVSADGEGLANMASHEAHPIVVPDLPHSPIYSDRSLEKHGVRAALIVPLRLQHTSFGALGACSKQKIDFEVDAIYVAETIAHLVATTLAHYRSETLLQESLRATETLYDTLDAIVLGVDSQGRVQTMNRASTEITGFSANELRDRHIWSVLAPPDEVAAYRGAMATLVATGPPLALEASLLTKHSDRRTVAWRFGQSPAMSNGSPSFLFTGIDITEQRRAEQRAERAKKALAHLRETGPDDSDAAENELRLAGRSGELASGYRPTDTERRFTPRRPFPYRQNVAYMTGNAYPCEECFSEVRCRDIAAGGFSFVSPQPPDSDKLVVALGSPRHLTYLTARVVHVTETVDGNELVHLIGCQYTGRAPS